MVDKAVQGWAAGLVKDAEGQTCRGHALGIDLLQPVIENPARRKRASSECARCMQPRLAANRAGLFRVLVSFRVPKDRKTACRAHAWDRDTCPVAQHLIVVYNYIKIPILISHTNRSPGRHSHTASHRQKRAIAGRSVDLSLGQRSPCHGHWPLAPEREGRCHRERRSKSSGSHRSCVDASGPCDD